jgi:hypothetical protein
LEAVGLEGERDLLFGHSRIVVPLYGLGHLAVFNQTQRMAARTVHCFSCLGVGVLAASSQGDCHGALLPCCYQ